MKHSTLRPLALTLAGSAPGVVHAQTPVTVTIDTAKRHQTIEGFGTYSTSAPAMFRDTGFL